MARRDGRPEDAGEGKHPPQILYRARLSAVLRYRVPSPNRSSSDRDGPLTKTGVGPKSGFQEGRGGLERC